MSASHTHYTALFSKVDVEAAPASKFAKNALYRKQSSRHKPMNLHFYVYASVPVSLKHLSMRIHNPSSKKKTLVLCGISLFLCLRAG